MSATRLDRDAVARRLSPAVSQDEIDAWCDAIEAGAAEAVSEQLRKAREERG